jgi:alginate O-acetyltransferase complex protein AlgI
MEAASDAVDFALYLAYFPKLISGPIERARSFLPRLAGARQVDGRALTRSLTLILVGMARKLLIADPLRIMTPQDVFTTPAAYAPSLLATWLLAYAFSLYNDFAGYTGLVRGISGLFGIELSSNFRQPYLARSFTEFWNRWHITLSHWLRDYIYYPLSRALLRRNPSRRSVLNLALPPLVTMLMSGLWHGASWHMLLWGGLHGVYQVVERIPSLWRPVVPSQKQPRWRQVIAAVIVFVLAVLAWLPFSMRLPAAAAFLRGLFTWTRWEAPDVRVFALIVPSVLLDWAQYHSGDEVVFLRWPRPARALALTFVVLAVVLLATQTAITAPPFVYQGF